MIYSNGNGPRRSANMVYCDVLIALAERSRSRTELMKIANLNKKTFEKYVERYLVNMGYVRKKWINRKTMYMITRKGRFYLGTLAWNPEITNHVLYFDNMFAAKVAEELRRQGAEVALNAGMCIEAELEPLADIVVRYEGSEAAVLVAATRPGVIIKLNYAIILASMIRSSNRTVYILVPRSMEIVPRSRGVVGILYPEGNAVAAAKELLKNIVSATVPLRGAATGRVIRI